MPRIFSLFLLLLSLGIGSSSSASEPRQVDERRARLAGIRVIASRHLRLYTDLPAGNAVDELGQVFDEAVSAWGRYFGITEEKTSRWRMQGFLMQDRAKFVALDLLPETKPNFANGYCQGHELWLMDQPSDYYRRHLLLHEGTHGFMYAFVGEDAPGWYMEGMAELLATHRWQQAELKLRHFPQVREETPMWGRIKFIREGEPLPLEGVLGLRQGRTLAADQYAWCWALCKFLDSHPHWHDRFRQAHESVGVKDFNRRFRSLFRSEWANLEFEWQAFVAALDYGYDLARMSIDHAEKVISPRSEECDIAAEAGWQSTGWLLQAGNSYYLSATGRYTIANDTQPWACEPGGVTLQYHDGQPLGKLLGLLRPTEGTVDFSTPLAIGLGAEIAPKSDSILYLRVNDSPARLSDNRGKLRVRCKLLSIQGSSD